MKLAAALIALLTLAFVPSLVGPYPLGLMIGILGYGILATAWALFSGPTRYISLATVAFFGLGAYTVAVLSETLPYPLVLLAAAAIGLVVALLVGLATLRLAGIYFVIFTFGLTELVRQLVTYYEVNVTRTLGRYVFLPFGPEHIYWQLLALLAATLAIAFWVRQSKIGLALRVIGDDPVVASHLGIRITRVKLTLFSISAVIMTLAGAIQAPRWTYMSPPSCSIRPPVSLSSSWPCSAVPTGCSGRCWAPSRYSCCLNGSPPISPTTIRSFWACCSSPLSSFCPMGCWPRWIACAPD